MALDLLRLPLYSAARCDMNNKITLVLVAALTASSGTADSKESDGHVTLPLDRWTGLLGELDTGDPAAPTPPVDIASLERTLEGSFRKGLLSATLVARFQVFDDSGHIRVPVISAEASPSKVRLNGKPTSLVKHHGMYTVGVDKPGVYQVEVSFYLGQEQDRFARRLQVELPPGGVTQVSLLVPESDITARLEHGTLTAHEKRANGTQLLGYLDATGLLDLSWSRRVTHKGSASVQMQVSMNTLFTVREAVVSGVAVFDVDVLDGETDRLDLQLPAELEVTKVTGDAVLQWRSDAERLTVLLRYLVEGRTRMAVHFQYAVDDTKPIGLRMPLPADGIEMTGAVGVQAPPGLQVKVANIAQARELTTRDLPSELTSLTGSPLLFGFSYNSAPEISLSVARLQQVELTSTLIDEIEASTVLIEDGTEITKMRLHIRNNTRQYLRVRLGERDVLTHALIDGQPVRPARDRNEPGQTLLFSLRQSERVDPTVGRVHRVRRGETLGDIAHAYYTDPAKWTVILDGNRDQLSSEMSVRVGQVLRIPSAGPITVEESSFVLELAFRRERSHLGSFGSADLTLPEFDVDAMKVTWHLYLPKSLTPLSFSANLTQYSRIRYGTLRRLLDFLDEALGGRNAWAGGKKYQSILKQRRQIYQDQVERKSISDVSPASFPLVGERYRFKRILMDRDQPRVTVYYAANSLLSWVRWVALLAALALAFMMLRPTRRWWQWLIAGSGALLLLVVGHYVLGVHKRLIWGVDLALLVSLFGLWRARTDIDVRELLWSPWRALRLLTLDKLYYALALLLVLHLVLDYPLLLSSIVMIALFGLWQRWSAQAAKEADHA